MATWCEELTAWKRPWCWERLKVGGEGDSRGWDGWMASPIRWTWVWVSSRSWWWAGMPSVLQSIGLQSQTWLCNWIDYLLLIICKSPVLAQIALLNSTQNFHSHLRIFSITLHESFQTNMFRVNWLLSPANFLFFLIPLWLIVIIYSGSLNLMLHKYFEMRTWLVIKNRRKKNPNHWWFWGYQVKLI